jgi:hypothetical protein
MKVSEIKTLSDFDRMWRDPQLQNKIWTYAKKRRCEEVIEFLNSMRQGAKSALTFEKYIKAGAAKPINIDGNLRKKFDAIAATKGGWDKAPWDEATIVVLRLFRENFVQIDDQP